MDVEIGRRIERPPERARRADGDDVRQLLRDTDIALRVVEVLRNVARRRNDQHALAVRVGRRACERPKQRDRARVGHLDADVVARVRSTAVVRHDVRRTRKVRAETHVRDPCANVGCVDEPAANREMGPVPDAGNTFTITNSALGATPTVPRLFRAAAIMPDTCVPCAPGGVLYASPGTNEVLSAALRFGARSVCVAWIPASSTATRTPRPL